MLLELPHTAACLVCGTANPRSLRLSLFLDPASRDVSTTFLPTTEHVGFEGILHGGILMTVADEAMAWAAIAASRRLCLAAEVTTRFKSPAHPNESLEFAASIVAGRPGRMLEARCRITRMSDSALVAEAAAKFIPLPPSKGEAFFNSLLPHPKTEDAARYLR